MPMSNCPMCQMQLDFTPKDKDNRYSLTSYDYWEFVSTFKTGKETYGNSGRAAIQHAPQIIRWFDKQRIPKTCKPLRQIYIAPPAVADKIKIITVVKHNIAAPHITKLHGKLTYDIISIIICKAKKRRKKTFVVSLAGHTHRCIFFCIAPPLFPRSKHWQHSRPVT